MPGYTHLQPAQPVLFAHHLLAYCEMLERDDARSPTAVGRTNVLPLGAGALAGTTFPIDREYRGARARLSPRQPEQPRHRQRSRLRRSSSSPRGAILAMHLSRLADEIVLWASPQFGFVELPDAFATGSSMMPQKKNPDVAELVRGKTGRVYGNLIALLTTMKGLPLAYNRDLQEDKAPLFDTVDTLSATLSSSRRDAAAPARARRPHARGRRGRLHPRHRARRLPRRREASPSATLTASSAPSCARRSPRDSTSRL